LRPFFRLLTIELFQYVYYLYINFGYFDIHILIIRISLTVL
jgi:hypothetical protein